MSRKLLFCRLYIFGHETQKNVGVVFLLELSIERCAPAINKKIFIAISSSFKTEIGSNKLSVLHLKSKK